MRLCRLAFPSALLASALALTGCSGFQDAASLPVASVQVHPGAISGTVYGGHLPIAGAHVFVFEAQDTGYAHQVVSRLSSSTSGVSVDYAGSNTSNPTFGDYFVTTSSTGGFNITGDYTCTSGNPVYLYAQGGSTSAGTPTTDSVTQAVVSTATTDVNGASYQTVTITVANAVSLAAGTPVTFTGFTGLLGPTTSSVTAATTNSNTFVVTAPAAAKIASGSYTSSTFGSNAAALFFQTSVAANPQIVNMGMLGLCPGETNEFANTLSNVVLNEVSTVAMAEAMSGFASSTTGTATNAVHIGSSSTNLLGLQNAAVNASQLYNITGAGPVGSGGNGNANDANTVTPAGNGVVPQALIDTIANILAACVDDSTNTYNPYGYNSSSPAGFGAGATSTSTCGSLFENATSAGVMTSSITAAATATDTASAAINIAHFPAGTPSSLTSVSPFSYNTTFVSNLYALQALNTNSAGTANKPPFVPALTAAPNDFTVAIRYPSSNSANANLAAAESIAIDASGNAWLNSGSYVIEMSPLGVITYTSPAASYNYGYVSIDPSGNIWSGNEGATSSSETEFTPGSSTTVATYAGPYSGGLYNAMSTVSDGSGNIFVGAANPSAISQSTLVEMTSSASSVQDATPFTSGSAIAHGAIDASGYVWETAESASAIGRFSGSTASSASFTNYAGGNGLINPEQPAIDQAGTMWVPNAHLGNQQGALMKVSTSGKMNTFTGGNQDNPYGLAIDGMNHLWMTSQCSTNCKDGSTSTSGPFSSLLEFDDSADILSPTQNFTTGGQIPNPLNVAVDPSGVLWVTSKVNGYVSQVFGPAAPTYTPLSVAAKNSDIATRP